MSFGRRMMTELRHLVGSGAGRAYVAAGVGRLLARTAVAFLVHRVSACSGFCAAQTALPRPVHVLRNPIRIAPGLPPRAAEDLDRPYRFVFVGRVTRDKGWDTVVDAAALLACSGRDFRVDVIGDGNDRAAMEQAVAAAGQGERFRFLGRLDPAATQGAIAHALCALMPSRFQEPAGYIPLEAAACRVPSIVARVGGLPETAGPDCPSFEVGCAEEMAAHMSGFLDDPARALAAGHAAYLRAARLFAPRRIADELLQLLHGGQVLAPAC
jgi:glycosyltransferase involved in cell wall biosynthesis